LSVEISVALADGGVEDTSGDVRVAEKGSLEAGLRGLFFKRVGLRAGGH
jgi:hypothetical protein